jgi:hypothetical protein
VAAIKISCELVASDKASCSTLVITKKTASLRRFEEPGYLEIAELVKINYTS